MQELHHYCTLFDKHYLYKGLTLYHSLQESGASFHLWILAMDTECQAILKKLKLKHASVIALADFEDPELCVVKEERTPVEYCWTITPSLPLFLLQNKKLSEVTYIDADLYFFSNPQPIFDELENSSILLIEHRYSPAQVHLEKFSGKFNVQCMTFKNKTDGLSALKWWRERCLEWCFHRYEDGKLGDQLYLHDWETRFSGVHVLQHLGAGVAPWNIQQYSVEKTEWGVTVADVPLIFYHFHAYKIYTRSKHRFAPGYWIPWNAERYIYAEYRKKLIESIDQVKAVDPNWQWGFTSRPLITERIGLFLVASKKYIQDLIKQYIL